jgi:DNA-binding HxlR family transcriptional regulator
MGWDEISNSYCPIARALALVGDRWTMLIMMELVRGQHRFDELQAQTGMSSHLLSTRLKRMEADGLIERRAYSERPPRYEYYATAKGKGLDPVLLMLRSWGRKWEGDCPDGKPATLLRHKKTGQVVDDLCQLPGGGRNFTFDQLEATANPLFAAERERRREAFYDRTGKAPKAEAAPAAKKAPAKTAKPAAARRAAAPKAVAKAAPKAAARKATASKAARR